jgi:tetratricopeptide (TPR) repeat protein
MYCIFEIAGCIFNENASMFRSFFILLLSLFFFTAATAQFKQKADSLNLLVTKAVSDSDKVVALGNLAEFYYAYELDRKGDSILQAQLTIAEISDNKNLLLIVLFGNVVTNIASTKNFRSWRSNETLNRAITFIQKGLEYAKETRREDYTALSYIRLAELYRSMGLLERAYYHASVAFTTAMGAKNDSVKIAAAIELGYVYLARGESLLAYKAFTNAYDDAININNYTLQSEVFHCYAALYKTLKNNQQVKENLYRSIELNRQHHYAEGLIKDYIELGRFTDERFYIDKAIFLADSIRNEKYIIQAKRLLYGYYAFVVANSDSTLQYINRNEDLKQVYFLGDSSKYFSVMGSIYHFANKCDTAIYYMKLAEPGFQKNFAITSLQNLYGQLADCYDKANQPQEAIMYYQKAAALNTELKDAGTAVNYNNSLSNLYEKIGKYREAFMYSRRAVALKDSLQKLSDQREIALMEVNNEKKEHEARLEKMAKEKLIKTNLQYMAITILISLVFLAMILMGMFPVSKFTNKILGYFAFISLFEFVILLLDTFLHKWAHGEPLWIWVFKIFIVAILAPFHHYLEKAMKKFIESRRLIKLREKLSIKNWWPSHHKNPASVAANNKSITGDVM